MPNPEANPEEILKRASNVWNCIKDDENELAALNQKAREFILDLNRIANSVANPKASIEIPDDQERRNSLEHPIESAKRIRSEIAKIEERINVNRNEHNRLMSYNNTCQTSPS